MDVLPQQTYAALPPAPVTALHLSNRRRTPVAPCAVAEEPRLDMAPRSSPRILIVDDDDSVRETLAELLEISGFIPIKAAHAGEALEVLRRDLDVDALVTDLSMPGDDGVALIHQARTVRSGLPAILLTGYAEEATSVSAGASGNFHILRKPVESDRLIEQLRRMVPSASDG